MSKMSPRDAVKAARQERTQNPFATWGVKDERGEVRQPIKGRRRRVTSATITGLAMEFVTSRWDWLDESQWIQKRTIEGRIMWGDRVIGWMVFYEYRCIYSLADRDFFEEMDAASAETYQLAVAFLAGWRAADLAGGTLLEFNALWMDPAFAHNSIWLEFAEHLIGQARDAGVMLFKPFPLEMTGAASEGLPDAIIDRRCRAMQRLYARTLRGLVIPGAPDWMYRPLWMTKAPYHARRKRRY